LLDNHYSLLVFSSEVCSKWAPSSEVPEWLGHSFHSIGHLDNAPLYWIFILLSLFSPAPDSYSLEYIPIQSIGLQTLVSDISFMGGGTS
jgi:hypothetical protein